MAGEGGYNSDKLDILLLFCVRQYCVLLEHKTKQRELIFLSLQSGSLEIAAINYQ